MPPSLLQRWCFSLKEHGKCLRNVKEFKLVRFKSSGESFEGKKDLQWESCKLRSQILSEILKCNILTAQNIIVKNDCILGLNHDHFCQNAKFLHKYLKLTDFNELSRLLTMPPSLLQHRFFSLKELGFYIIAPFHILRFLDILKETPKSLKVKRYPFTSEHKCDILNEYLDISKRTEINNKLQCMYEDGSNLQKIKEAMNAEFLAIKLECSIDRAHQILHNCTTLRVQSILKTDQLLNILLHRFGFSISKICGSPFLLSVPQETIEHILSEVPEILGVNIVFMATKSPRMLKQQGNYLKKVEAILKDFNITKDQLICCPKILSVASNTLEKRLTFLHNTEDFAVLKSNKRFLWLAYNFKNLNSRLKRLKNENMSFSINMFTVSKNTFEKYLMYSNSRTLIRETCVYLADILKMSEKEIYSRLRRYSSSRNDVQDYSVLNCCKVLQFLSMSGVSEEQIFNGLEIVFYEIDTVKLYFKNLKDHHACQPFEEWILHYNLIQLLIYTIEVTAYHSYKIESYKQEDQLLEYSSF